MPETLLETVEEFYLKAWGEFVNCQDDRYFGNRTKMEKQLDVLRKHFVPRAALASLQPSVSEMRLLRDSVLFAVWAAGEGITPADSEGVRAPEDFLMDFSNATGEEGWETLADRLPALSPEGEP
jgi:hypothetical protein